MYAFWLTLLPAEPPGRGQAEHHRIRGQGDQCYRDDRVQRAAGRCPATGLAGTPWFCERLAVRLSASQLQPEHPAEPAVDIVHERERQVADRRVQVGLVEGHQRGDVYDGIFRQAREC